LNKEVDALLDLLAEGNAQQAMAAYHALVVHLHPQTKQWLESVLGLYELAGNHLLTQGMAGTALAEDSAYALKALNSYCQNEEAQTVRDWLRKLSYNSAYRDFRLILATLLEFEKPTASLTRLERVSASSPYTGIVRLIRLSAGNSDTQTESSRLNANERQFIHALRTQQRTVSQSEFSTDAKPEQVFEWVLENADVFDPAIYNSLLINLLVDAPSALDTYQTRFGKLSTFELSRIQALASEQSGDWPSAIQSWTDCLQSSELQHLDNSEVTKQLILQRISDCHAQTDDDDPTQRISILEQRYHQNPDDLDACRELLEHYQSTLQTQAFNQVLKQAVERFPDNADIVAIAVEQAANTAEFEQAAVLARHLLNDDSLNPGTRRLLIQAYLSYADKLALRGQSHAALTLLEQTEALERPKSSGIVSLHRALVYYVIGDETRAQQSVEQGCRHLGSYLTGYFIMAIETNRLGFKAKYKKQYLKLIQSLVGYRPDPEEMVFLIQRLWDNTKDANIDNADLIAVLSPFLQQSLNTEFNAEQLLFICETLEQMNVYEALHLVALNACQRAGFNHHEFEYYRIVGATQGNPAQINLDDYQQLEQLLDDLPETNPQLQSRITAFLNANLAAGTNNDRAFAEHGISPALNQHAAMKPTDLLSTIKRLFQH